MAATPRITTSGYIAIRWYQHSRHGSKWATSEKYRLPTVARVATTKATSNALDPRLDRRPSSQRAAVDDPRAVTANATSPMTATFATRASKP